MVIKTDFLSIRQELTKIEESKARSMALSRLEHAELLYDNETSRQQSPEIYLKNLATQLKRALGYKSEIGVDVSSLQEIYRKGRVALSAGNFQLAHELFVNCLDAYPWQNEAHEAFPWQTTNFASFTDMPAWREKHGIAHNRPIRIVEYDLDAIGHITDNKALTTSGANAENDAHQFLKPFNFTGESKRPIIFVVPGNRAHLACMEWQDPVYKDRLRCTEYAEHYTFRYMHALTDEILRLRELPEDKRPITVGLVFGGVASRHENRLEHFATYEAGKRGELWTHPRVKATAEELFYQIFAKVRDGNWVVKSTEELANATPYAAITFSIGSTASEQLINRGVRIARNLGFSQVDIDAYFSRGVATYVSGYQSDNVGKNASMLRLIISSILDENVNCAPDPDNDVGALGFTSPAHTPIHSWQHLSKADLLNIAMGRFENVKASECIQFADNPHANVRLICGAMAIAFNDKGELAPGEIMAANRFGHFIPPQVESIKNNTGLNISETMLAVAGAQNKTAYNNKKSGCGSRI